MNMNRPIISRNDVPLLKLLPDSARLRDKLAAAAVVPARRVPVDVVTMNSKVKYRDETRDEPRYVKLVYPQHADGMGRVSVLAPLGAALLGLSIGQEAEADIPGVGPRRIRVLDIVSQPEREGRRRAQEENLEHFAFTLGF